MGLIDTKLDIQGKPETISHPTEDDICSGKRWGNTPGNIHYNRLVQLHAPDYASTPNRQKSFVVKRVVDAVIHRGGRFVKGSNGHFVCLNTIETHRKVVAALRKAVLKLNKTKQVPPANESAPPAIMVPTMIPPSTMASENSVWSYNPDTSPKQQAIVASVTMSPGGGGSKSDATEPSTDFIDSQHLSNEPMDGVQVLLSSTGAYALGIQVKGETDLKHIAYYKDQETAVMAGNFIMNCMGEGMTFEGAMHYSFDVHKPTTF